MADYVTIEQLEELTTIEEDVAVEGVGLFRIRALSFGDMIAANEAADDGQGTALMTAYVVHGVAQPELTDEVVRALPADAVNQLVEAISGLSGSDTGFTTDSPDE